MQVTSLLSHDEKHGHDHAQDESNCTPCGHEHAPVRLVADAGRRGFCHQRVHRRLVLWSRGHTVASASAMIGAIILGYPIVWTAIKDLQRGVLSINELVGHRGARGFCLR